MAAAQNRLLTLCLALIFLISTTMQLVPCGATQTDIGVRADMADGCFGAKAPCGDHKPTCIDHLGCISAPAMPASPALLAVAFEWASPIYELATAALAGISVKPELSPPIIAA
jgi:hypothetical protein